MSKADAMIYLDEAISAISVPMTIATSSGRTIEIEGPESTIAIELDRVHRSMIQHGTSIFSNLAEQIRECAIALHAARAALAQAPVEGSSSRL